MRDVVGAVDYIVAELTCANPQTNITNCRPSRTNATQPNPSNLTPGRNVISGRGWARLRIRAAAGRAGAHPVPLKMLPSLFHFIFMKARKKTQKRGKEYPSCCVVDIRVSYSTRSPLRCLYYCDLQATVLDSP